MLPALVSGAAVLAQTPTAPKPVVPLTAYAGLGRAIYTNDGWPGTLATVGFQRPFSATSLFSLQTQLGFFEADKAPREPDKNPGEQYAAFMVDGALAVRTSRHPERLALRVALGPGLVAGRVTNLVRYPGQYLNRDGTVTVVTSPQYETERLLKPTAYWGLGLDIVLNQRLCLAGGIESRTYSYFPGDLLSANVRLGYQLR
ncbi:hypothetical protein [Hymenobacter rubripertinctus]|uniref:Outer membrane protein beta-barrel domain-containing protein n=1 Tax=Hymenobacter rubripertinctus TaxID=2029981 RepID=A0A418QNE3_9BACT|nr:hypothetical protein [Hymenobacter rubripertinctus]RIY06621.1 hypothetical protein D0T11_18280 [Hymenobacter rubripertinctus]